MFSFVIVLCNVFGVSFNAALSGLPLKTSFCALVLRV